MLSCVVLSREEGDLPVDDCESRPRSSVDETDGDPAGPDDEHVDLRAGFRDDGALTGLVDFFTGVGLPALLVLLLLLLLLAL